MLSGFLMFLSIWFALEDFEFPRKRPTLIYNLVSGNWRPLVAIIVGSTVVGLLSEFANLVAPVHHWIYYGIPFPRIAIFGVPISPLLAWSVMYILFLSLENIPIKADEKIWD